MNPRSEKLAALAADRNEWDDGFHLYTQCPRISPPAARPGCDGSAIAADDGAGRFGRMLDRVASERRKLCQPRFGLTHERCAGKPSTSERWWAVRMNPRIKR